MADNATNGLLGRADLTALPRKKTIDHTIESEGDFKGKKIRFTVMSSDRWQEIARLRYRWIEYGDPFNMHGTVVQACAVDGNGKLLFDEDDIESLGRQGPMLMAELYGVCEELVGQTPELVEELEKKSPSPTGINS